MLKVSLTYKMLRTPAFWAVVDERKISYSPPTRSVMTLFYHTTDRLSSLIFLLTRIFLSFIINNRDMQGDENNELNKSK